MQAMRHSAAGCRRATDACSSHECAARADGGYVSDVTDALESWLAHPGTRLFMDYVRTEWAGAGYGRKIKEALADARARNLDAAAAVDKVDYANDRIGEVVGWPKQELARVMRQEQGEPTQEVLVRQPPISALAGMNRRGSL